MTRARNWQIDIHSLRNSPEAARLRAAAAAWTTAPKSVAWTMPMSVLPDDAEFAFTFDAELLAAASAYDAAVRRARQPHEDMAYGLRLMLSLAEKYLRREGLPPARGKARTRQDFSLSKVKAWIETLPKRGKPL